MVYLVLERQGRISSPLSEAIDIEFTISDVLQDTYEPEHPYDHIRRLQEEAREISADLSDEEKFITEAVGKGLWYLRVISASNPKAHPEYCDDIKRQLGESVQRIQWISDNGLRECAELIIEDLDLPTFGAKAA
jgi:hypothetical protein